MTGAEALLKTAAAAGVEVCFANIGTTELPTTAAFDETRGIKPVLGLFEGVCTGAADGYGRMMDKPALTLLHLGPGFGNGIANLHNARRANTPIVNVVGDHASWHLSSDSPLTMDISSLAKTVSGWQRHNLSIETLSRDMADAITAALYGQVSTLIIPSDHQWLDFPGNEISRVNFSFDPIDGECIKSAAKALKGARKPLIIMGGPVLRARGLKAAGRIQAMTGCDLLSTMFPPCMDRGTGLPAPLRVPYFPEDSIKLLSAHDLVILAGAKAPVAFFGYKGGKSALLNETTDAIRIDGDKQNALEALEALADSLDERADAVGFQGVCAGYEAPEIPYGKLTRGRACRIVAALQPENAIIIDEGNTSSGAYFLMDAGLSPHTYMTNTGGAIGLGMPCAIGAAIACPDRHVINLQADGSAMYTVQALWTQAREELNITTLICANRSYAILRMELARAGYRSTGPAALSLIDLGNPAIGWVQIGQGMGVPAVSVETCEDLAKELKIAFAEPGPHLIEMLLR